MTRAFVAAAAVILLAACTKSDSRGTDTAALNAVGGAPAAQQRTPGPGELTKPLADYTGEELYQLTEALQYAGASERHGTSTASKMRATMSSEVTSSASAS